MTCKNCNNILIDGSEYCNLCGGKIIRNRLTFKNLFEHVSETFFNYDNKLLRTFIDLFIKPEEVIVGYINGVRKRYVNVFSYFALALTISGIQIFIIQKFQTDITFYDTSTAIGQQQQAMFEKIYKFSNDYQSLVIMLYIPIYALMARVVFLGTKLFNYVETLVIFIYTQAQISICLAVLTAIVIPLDLMSFTTLGMVVLPIQFFYYIYSLKRIYKLSTGQIALRTILFLGVLTVAFVLFSILVGVLMYLNGDMEQMIEAQRALKDSTSVN
ncbi:DUF3667 domain-containing protein [Ichthyenterobacterium sp. W332]|uniref:DUF3667 domain-containing protein n=1 Tax=Microcosmobacter mediterraneus TaxID=3075607 RepID=A0ABU2YFQ8_9FLAO|nr:DUF3667 domain-containing protein [Ichthyenterobacterium sp. W332]MDT0557015.1 DUF3667 domain-containing protein [Ichthyenterobacterium sp. W332]